MTLPRIVFHCADQDLFERFVRGLSRQVLIRPLRKDSALQKRHFRGFRISGTRPDAASVSRAYHKEINQNKNAELLDYLCKQWVLAHEGLALGAFVRLGIQDVDLNMTTTWFPLAADTLKGRGYFEAAGDVTRALAFDYPVEDILTVISILSIDCEEQSGLREHIEQEFRTTHDDPRALLKALTAQHRQKADHLKRIEDLRAAAASKHAKEAKPVSDELTKLVGRKKKLDNTGLVHENFRDSQKKLEEAREMHDEAREQYGRAETAFREWKAKLAKLDTGVGVAQEKLKQLKTTHEARVAAMDTQKKEVESEIAEIGSRLDAVKSRMPQATTASDREEESAGDTDSSSATPTATAYSFKDLFDFVSRPGFVATPVTLDICVVYLQGRLEVASIPPRPTNFVNDPEASSLYLAHRAVHGDPPWSGAALSDYALVRSLHEAMDSSERRLELIIGGLYHGERRVDLDATESLLARSIDLLHEGAVASAGQRGLPESLDALGDCQSDASVMRGLGSLQTKLATATPTGLRALYDAMQPALRIVAKRALLSQVQHLDLQDTDPAHEVLDLVTTNLESLLGPLTGGLNTWGPQATLQADVRRRRQSVLAASAKLPHIFSQSTNDRLANFRDLLGPQLTTAISDDTLDGYDLFRRLLLDYCVQECGGPEWISSRYLFPTVMSLGRVASRADHEARKRKPDVSVVLEKRQQPVGTAQQGLPLRIQLKNSGEATARDLRLEVEADKQAVTINPGEYRVTKLVPDDSVWLEGEMNVAEPVSAVELACILEWREPSGERESRQPVLKLTAQRVINWAEARANPYSLRSISSQERLMGRDNDLEALRIGINGGQSFCITGQKRVGKTSVARVLHREFQDSNSHVALYLTLGDLAVYSWQALIYSLYEAIDDELISIDRAGEVELPSAEEFAANPSRKNRAIIKSFERRLDGRRVLCVIDDFDEIGEGLYKGDNGKELFLLLRTLIDRGDFSFVLVGSEKLPDIFKHQGERLNQVQRRSLNYFRDVSLLHRLVVGPAQPHLEFSDGAVGAIWRYSAGNPYYATQICVRVYEDMLAQKDHYVAEGDVLRGVDAICRDSSVNNFQHFWTDGVFEGGLDITRLQYLNAAIQSACARCCAGPNEKWVERSVLRDERSLGNYDPAQIGFRLDNLVDRGVLLQDGNRVRLRIPLFESWLLLGGDAAVRSSFSEEVLETRLTPRPAGPTSRAVVEVAKDLSYQGRPVSEDKVRAWLEQFGPARNQDLALRLLKRLKSNGHYDTAKMHNLSKMVHGMILREFADAREFARSFDGRNRVRNVFLSNLGREGQSGARVLSLCRNANSWPVQMAGSMDDAIKFVDEQREKGKRCAVVFVDDFIGTGGSVIGGLQRFREKLDGDAGSRGHLIVGVTALVGFKHGVEAVRNNPHLDCHVKVAEELGPEDRAFAPGAGIFETEEDCRAAENLCRAIGKFLEPKQPMGYGECEALVCFSDRCPNNTLPVFYKEGMEYQGREWIPLFPR